MVVGKQKVLDYFKMNNAQYFKIKKSKDGNLYYQTADSGLSTSDALIKLEQALNNMDTANYFLEFWNDSNATGAKHFSFDFQLIDENNKSFANIGSIQQPLDVNEQIAKALKDYQLNEELIKVKAENVELTKQLKEKEKEENEFFNKLIKKTEPYLGSIISAFVPTVPTVTPIAGIPTEENELQERLETAFKTWEETPENQLLLIEGIVNLQKNNIDTYNMAKNFILQK